MFTAIVMAYMLNGNPVLKSINIPHAQVGSFYKPKKTMKGKVEMKCAIFLKKEYKSNYMYYSPTSCKDLKKRFNKERWR